MNSLYLKIQRLSRKLSVRALGFAIIAIIAALVATKATSIVPEVVAEVLGSPAVEGILKIMASSMLAVVAFSLTTTIAAFNSASQGATPRAAQLLIEDQGSQNALSIFLGSFIFSILSIIALSTGYYDDKGKTLLLIFTVLIITVVVITMIGWIEKLSKLGRVHETILKVEKVTENILRSMNKEPLFQCQKYENGVASGRNLMLDECGYLQWVDHQRLNEIAKEEKGYVYIEKGSGSLISSRTVVAKLKDFKINEEVENKIRQCFVVGKKRTYDQDIRFGFVTLSEVASRALSPGINDPGTAIEVLASAHRLFHLFDERKKPAPVKRERVFVRCFKINDLFDDLFHPLSRDGAAHYEVINRMLKVLSSLVDSSHPEVKESAKKYAQWVYQRAMQALIFEQDKKLLKERYSSIQDY